MKMQKILSFLALLLVVSGLAACAAITATSEPAVSQNGIRVFDPWVRAAVMKQDMGGEMQSGGAVTGAFMLVQNTNDQADMLLSAASEAAEDVQIHETTMRDGVMSMAEIYGIEIPAQGHVELKPGGYHIMLIGLKEELKDGDTLTIMLYFQNAGEVAVETVVRNP